jgi:hypothetical protein
MQYVVDRNVVMWCIPVYCYEVTGRFHPTQTCMRIFSTRGKAHVNIYNIYINIYINTDCLALDESMADERVWKEVVVAKSR